jgi:hypothetical protein
MRSTTWLALTAIALSCKREPPPPAPHVDPASITWPTPVDAAPKPDYRSDPPASLLDEAVAGKGKTFMVVSAQLDATKVGKAILAAGGNAVDAAVATAFALAVTNPYGGHRRWLRGRAHRARQGGRPRLPRGRAAGGD